MFDIGWTEMLVIAVVMIVVVGPKDLPGMLRTFGKTTKKLRSMAGDFQKQFNEALKEAELDDVKKSVDSLRSLNPAAEIKKQLNPFEKVAAEVRSGLDAAMKPKPAEPASPVTHAAEPLKNGATAMPAAAASSVAPAAPAFPAMSDPAVATSTQAIPDDGVLEAAPKAAKASAPKKGVATAKPAAKAAPAARAAAKPVAAKSAAKQAASTPAKTTSSKQKPAGSAT